MSALLVRPTRAMDAWVAALVVISAGSAVLSSLVLDHATSLALGSGLLVALGLLIGWSNAASP